jgi:transposase
MKMQWRTTTRRVAILRRHLREKERVSDLCEELGLQSTVFCRWQKEFFENGAAAFRHRGRGQPSGKTRTNQGAREERRTIETLGEVRK